MADFVLVHGSGQSAACWSRVRERLDARGHRTAAPDLAKQAPELGLEEHAERIASAVTGADTIVVAHSLSGAFLPLVARRTRCRMLVFLAAVVPEPGRSVREQFAADPTMFCPGWIEAGARWFDPVERDALAREFLFHDCDAATLSWALGTVELMDPGRIVTTPAPRDAWPLARSASIVARHDRTLSPDWIRRASRERLGAEPLELDAGHCPHVSRPDAVAALLEGLAGDG